MIYHVHFARRMIEPNRFSVRCHREFSTYDVPRLTRIKQKVLSLARSCFPSSIGELLRSRVRRCALQCYHATSSPFCVPQHTNRRNWNLNLIAVLSLVRPGGHQIEIGCPGARLVLAPDWKPIVWTEAERKRGQAWGLPTVATFHTYGTPPVEVTR